MAIRLKGEAHERIGVTGDIVTSLRVPVGWADRRFRVATSDGTLIIGTYAEGAYAFAIEVEGAGIVRPLDDGLELLWSVDWITISDVDDSAVTIREPAAMPLFGM
ncbi:hypothetical protein [Sphingomonas solaris]|uniref:Uncharacterized protein n=1 Tax=Alterirhizorhabdus solaris TaxID=2529389 RepID=A0A558R5T2_9SPHN|nr:hypothetical protein [Sphingomonas solaris]TVV74743.1 hypothetical protein FOY91_08815 [Sphingomonas solaris]